LTLWVRRRKSKSALVEYWSGSPRPEMNRRRARLFRRRRAFQLCSLFLHEHKAQSLCTKRVVTAFQIVRSQQGSVWIPHSGFSYTPCSVVWPTPFAATTVQLRSDISEELDRSPKNILLPTLRSARTLEQLLRVSDRWLETPVAERYEREGHVLELIERARERL
jgi:hypothetical protein